MHSKQIFAVLIFFEEKENKTIALYGQRLMNFLQVSKIRISNGTKSRNVFSILKPGSSLSSPFLPTYPTGPSPLSKPPSSVLLDSLPRPPRCSNSLRERLASSPFSPRPISRDVSTSAVSTSSPYSSPACWAVHSWLFSPTRPKSENSSATISPIVSAPVYPFCTRGLRRISRATRKK